MNTPPSDSRPPLHKPLSPQDAAALDALLESAAALDHATFDRSTTEPDATSPVSPAFTTASASSDPLSTQAPITPDPRRIAQVARLLRVLDHYPVEAAPADLTQRTLARIAEVQRRQKFFAEMGPAVAGSSGGGGGGLGRGFSWGELAAAAAVIIVGLSLALPMLEYNRQEARRIACAANLGSVGDALSNYAASFNGILPRLATTPGSPWYQVGQQESTARGETKSNSAHLYLLARTGYATPGDLACPENASAPQNMNAGMVDWPELKAVSYSYQNQFGPQPLRADRAPHMAVLADKNPLFSRQPKNEKLCFSSGPCTAPSAAHRNRGQNILHTNGSVQWNTKPVLSNGDNIWLAKGVSQYSGREVPSEWDDSFLVP